MIPSTHAMWIPAGTVHEIAALGLRTIYSAYLRAEVTRSDFATPRRYELSDPVNGLLQHPAEDIGVEVGLRSRAVLMAVLERSEATAPPLR